MCQILSDPKKKNSASFSIKIVFKFFFFFLTTDATEKGKQVSESYMDKAGKISTSFELVLLGSICRCFKGETVGLGGRLEVRKNPMFPIAPHNEGRIP